MKTLVVQSCLTLCDLMDCSLPSSSVLEIYSVGTSQFYWWFNLIQCLWLITSLKFLLYFYINCITSVNDQFFCSFLWVTSGFCNNFYAFYKSNSFFILFMPNVTLILKLVFFLICHIVKFIDFAVMYFIYLFLVFKFNFIF